MFDSSRTGSVVVQGFVVSRGSFSKTYTVSNERFCLYFLLKKDTVLDALRAGSIGTNVEN